MEQLNSYADSRLLNGCIYCYFIVETREHIPSKVFLDRPYPENLPVVGACLVCNNGFSSDEEYVAAFFETVIAKTTEPSKIRRKKIANLLERTPALRARIQNAIVYYDDRIMFGMEIERINRIIVKLARGHAAFELSQPCRHEPSHVWWEEIDKTPEERRNDFLSDIIVGMVGEVGSRNSQRIMVMEVLLKEPISGKMKKIGLVVNPWITVQEGRYSYLADDSHGCIRIRMLIGGYFACEVTWH